MPQVVRLVATAAYLKHRPSTLIIDLFPNRRTDFRGHCLDSKNERKTLMLSVVGAEKKKSLKFSKSETRLMVSYSGMFCNEWWCLEK